MIDYCWRYVQDEPGSLDFYAISPYWGTLVKTASRIAIPHLGLASANQSTERFHAATVLIPDSPKKCDPTRGKNIITVVVRMLLKFFPLFVAVRCVSVLFPRRKTGATVLDAASIDLLASEFGVAIDDKCLVRSLCRFARCRRLGLSNLAIVLGVFTPTDEMHAWIEVDAKPVLECPDFLGHYQAGVRFYER